MTGNAGRWATGAGLAVLDGKRDPALQAHLAGICGALTAELELLEEASLELAQGIVGDAHPPGWPSNAHTHAGEVTGAQLVCDRAKAVVGVEEY